MSGNPRVPPSRAKAHRLVELAAGPCAAALAVRALGTARCWPLPKSSTMNYSLTRALEALDDNLTRFEPAPARQPVLLNITVALRAIVLSLQRLEVERGSEKQPAMDDRARPDAARS